MGVHRDSWNFNIWLQGSKHLALKSSLYHWKTVEEWMSKMGLHDPFGYLQHKLWQKKRSRVKLTIWLLITKSRESTRPGCVQVKCDTLLKSSQQELQVCFRPCPNQRFKQTIIVPQSCETPNCGNFETSP